MTYSSSLKIHGFLEIHGFLDNYMGLLLRKQFQNRYTLLNSGEEVVTLAISF